MEKGSMDHLTTRSKKKVILSQIEEIERHCPVCGNLLMEIKCKRVCKRCGFFIGCSE